MKLNKVIIAFEVLILIILIISLPLAFGFGKTGKNITVLGNDYSLLNKKEISSRLQSEYPLPESITLRDSDQDFTLNVASFSAVLDVDTLSSDLLFRRLNKGVVNYFKAFFQQVDFPLEIKYDDEVLNQNINLIASQIDKPFVSSELILDSSKKTISLKNGQIGKTTDQTFLKELIINSLKNYQFTDPIIIPVSSVGSLPSEEDIVSAKKQAALLLGKSIELSVPDQTINLPDSTLISWWGFSQSCRSDQIQTYVDGLNQTLKKDPVDAVFKFDNGRVLDFQPASEGYTLNDPSLTDKICSSLSQLINKDDKSVKITVETVISSPKINTGDANDLGIKELLGSGSSTFKHSDAVRNFNVEKGASIVNRVLVAPGETFSFIKSLGNVTLAEGYKQAYVIKQGQTILDVGGGICQVSTTLFRAMLSAGLDITARTNHAYRVVYYEEDKPPGYDATVFIPSPDLKFVNDTGHYLLIQSTYDGVNKKLTYNIYGTSDGRQSSISNYRQWDSTPAPPSVYIDDPTLPIGKTIQDERSIPGLKTAFDWKVYSADGRILHQKTFQSVYTPWAAVYRRGTGQ